MVESDLQESNISLEIDGEFMLTVVKSGQFLNMEPLQAFVIVILTLVSDVQPSKANESILATVKSISCKNLQLEKADFLIEVNVPVSVVMPVDAKELWLMVSVLLKMIEVRCGQLEKARIGTVSQLIITSSRLVNGGNWMEPLTISLDNFV